MKLCACIHVQGNISLTWPLLLKPLGTLIFKVTIPARNQANLANILVKSSLSLVVHNTKANCRCLGCTQKTQAELTVKTCKIHSSSICWDKIVSLDITINGQYNSCRLALLWLILTMRYPEPAVLW